MEDNTITSNSQQAPIDLAKIIKKLWAAKKLYLIMMPIVLVCTYLLTLCVPRYYNCTVQLAPESNGNSASGTISSLASSFGLGGLDNLTNGDDAINIMLYPDLLKSPDFIITLFPIQVATKDGQTYTYYEYMEKHQQTAVWNKYIFGPINQMLHPTTPSPAYKPTDKINLRHLTSQQNDVIESISGKIKCAIDKKTDAISITVQDQDPEVCATIGDSVLNRIQRFITEYRTKKARNDYNYYKKLMDEAKSQYKSALGSYSGYADSHRNAVDQNVIAKTEDNSKNMNLKYQAYSTLALQLQAAEAKIQENTPAFTVIRSATLPQKPAGPKRMMVALIMTMLSFVILTVVVLLKK